jgi:hypothetical protein
MAGLVPAISFREAPECPRYRAPGHTGMPPKTRGSPRATELGRATVAEVIEGLFGQSVELGGLSVALDLLAKAFGIKRFKPRAKFRQPVRRQIGDRFFDVFDGRVTFISRRSVGVMAANYAPSHCRT